MTKFICISGKARHGKDTTATALSFELNKKGYSAIIVHYADLLKYICKNYFGWNGEKDAHGRTLLQQVGTDCIRAHDPNYWVDFVGNIAKMFPDKWDYIIVPDTRFPNEINRIKELGFDVCHIRVLRPEFDNELSNEQKAHISETALDNITPDYLLLNTSIDELGASISNLVDGWQKESQNEK